MYEIHPNIADQWVLFDTGDRAFDVIAWFPCREDAEFAREAFERRRYGNPHKNTWPRENPLSSHE
jgi:hypothetical protein